MLVAWRMVAVVVVWVSVVVTGVVTVTVTSHEYAVLLSAARLWLGRG